MGHVVGALRKLWPGFLFCPHTIIFYSLKIILFFIIQVQLIYNVVLVSGVQNRDSVRYITYVYAAAAAKSFQSCLTLCDPIDGSPPGSPVPGILQARTLLGCHFLLQCMKVKSQSEVTQSCPTLSDLMDCSLPGSSIHGIFQARVLEWGATAFSKHMYIHTYIFQIHLPYNLL